MCASTHIISSSQTHSPYDPPRLWTNNSVNPPPTLPPAQPVTGNIVGTGTHLLESANMSGGLSAELNCFEEEFLALLPLAASGDSDG